MNDNFINKLEESENIKNSDFIAFEKVKSDGTYLTNKISYYTLNTKLSTDISNIFDIRIKNLENQTNTIINSIYNKLDKRGLIYSSNNKMIGTLLLNSQLSGLSASHFNKNIYLNYSRITNLTSDEFTEDYDAVNKRYVDLKFIGLSFPNFNNLVKKTGDVMYGFLSSSVYPPTQNNHAITKQYIDSFENLNKYLPLSGGTLTGNLSVLNPVNINNAANKNYVDLKINNLSSYLPISGGELTGNLTIPLINNNSKNYISDVNYVISKTNNISNNVRLSGSSMNGQIIAISPLLDNEIATKKYVDDIFSNQNFLKISGGTLTGNLTTFSPPICSTEIVNKEYVDITLGDLTYLKKTGGESNNLSASSAGIMQKTNVINLSTDYLNLSGSNFYNINLFNNCSGINIDIDPDKFYNINLYINSSHSINAVHVVVDSNNNIYALIRNSFVFNNLGYNRYAIAKIEPNGKVYNFVGNLTSTNSETDGTGEEAIFASSIFLMKIDNNDNIYVCTENIIKKITPFGVVTTVLSLPAYNPPAVVTTIQHFDIDNSNNLYYIYGSYTKYNNQNVPNKFIYRVNLDTNQSTILYSPKISGRDWIGRDFNSISISENGNIMILTQVDIPSNQGNILSANTVVINDSNLITIKRFTGNKPYNAIINKFNSIYYFTDLDFSQINLDLFLFKRNPQGASKQGFTYYDKYNNANLSYALFNIDKNNNAYFAQGANLFKTNLNENRIYLNRITTSSLPQSNNLIHTKPFFNIYGYHMDWKINGNSILWKDNIVPNFIENRNVPYNINLMYVDNKWFGVLKNYVKFGMITSILFDSSNNMFICDKLNHKIKKITPSGNISIFAGSTEGDLDGTGSAAKFNNPSKMTIDSSNNIYVSDEGNHKIKKITPSGVVTTFAGSTQGYLEGTGTSAQFNSPNGITIDPSGNLYVCDSKNSKIRKITNTGVTSEISYALYPNGIARDTSGNLYVTNMFSHAIIKINTSNVRTTYAGTLGTFGDVIGTTTASKFNNPVDISIDSNNNLYISDLNNQKIKKIDTSTNTVTNIIVKTKINPFCVGLDSTGNIYTNITQDNIVKINNTGNITKYNFSINGLDEVNEVNKLSNNSNVLDLF